MVASIWKEAIHSLASASFRQRIVKLILLLPMEREWLTDHSIAIDMRNMLLEKVTSSSKPKIFSKMCNNSYSFLVIQFYPCF